MTDPTTTNTIATDADKVITTIEGILVPIAESAIQAAVPTLALPVIKQIVDAITAGLADQLTKLAETGVTFAIIDAQTDVEQWNMSDALKALISAEQSGDANAIQTAIQNYQKAQSSLVNDDGSAATE